MDGGGDERGRGRRVLRMGLYRFFFRVGEWTMGRGRRSSGGIESREKGARGGWQAQQIGPTNMVISHARGAMDRRHTCIKEASSQICSDEKAPKIRQFRDWRENRSR